MRKKGKDQQHMHTHVDILYMYVYRGRLHMLSSELGRDVRDN